MRREHRGEMARLVVEISAELKTWIKVLAAKRGTSMGEYVEKVLSEHVRKVISDGE